MTLSLLVPQEALGKVLRRLEKLAKTAGVAVDVLPGTTTLISDKRVLTCARVGIGDLPSVGGYEFAARIEHTKDGNVIVRGPSETKDLDESWRSAEARCDHCGKKRARKETFLLRQYGVALLQIGRNCLADFLLTDPSKMIATAELVKTIGGEMDDERWSSYSGHWEVSPLAYVACAVASIDRVGFRKTSEDGSTRDDADFLSGPAPSNGSRSYDRWVSGQPTDAQIERARLIAEWALTLTEPDLRQEYLWNLHLALKQSGVGKHAGLLASAPPAYDRALGRVAQRKIEGKKGAPADGYAAEEGFIFQGEVELVRINIVAGQYGSIAICAFRSDSGHEIIWFASGSAPRDIGSRYAIKGRCKRQEKRNGVCQTVLSRVSWKGFQGMQNHEGNRAESA